MKGAPAAGRGLHRVRSQAAAKQAGVVSLLHSSGRRPTVPDTPDGSRHHAGWNCRLQLTDPAKAPHGLWAILAAPPLQLSPGPGEGVIGVAGLLQGYIAVDTERVTARQPIAWLRTS